MELDGQTLEEPQEQGGIKTALQDKICSIYLGDVMDVWEDQRQVCVGSHVDFAKHLLALHKEYCLDYCRAESQEKAAVLSLCHNSQCMHEEKNCDVFQ